MEDRLLVTRERPLRDLVALAREAADRLRRCGADAQDTAIADALVGAAGQIAVDIHEPARLVDVQAPALVTQ